MNAVGRVGSRPSEWWLAKLRERASRLSHDDLALGAPPELSPAAQAAAIAYFNAAFRAEESGLRQAHELAERLRPTDPVLAEVLELYGNEEGWHRELLTQFLAWLGGGVRPMGRVTGTLYRLYARAESMQSIVLTNLMFETIGSTTYRMTLGRLRQSPTPQCGAAHASPASGTAEAMPALTAGLSKDAHAAFRRMLSILTRDEAFHVPLNVHFLREVMRGSSDRERLRLWLLHRALFWALCALPLASRPKAQAFDGIGRVELMRGYATHLAELSDELGHLGLTTPKLLLWLLGAAPRPQVSVASVEAAELSAKRENVEVGAL